VEPFYGIVIPQTIFLRMATEYVRRMSNCKQHLRKGNCNKVMVYTETRDCNQSISKLKLSSNRQSSEFSPDTKPSRVIFLNTFVDK
jgi:hypothetical protein